MEAPDRPSTDPTDRSMPAVRMTRSWPTAMIPKIATCRARLDRLLPVRNSSLARVRAPTATSSTTSPPLSRPAMSPSVMTRRRLGAWLAASAPRAVAVSSPPGAGW